MELTVVLSLYSEEQTVEDAIPVLSEDNNPKRSSATEFSFTEAERPNRTCHKKELEAENMKAKYFNQKTRKELFARLTTKAKARF